MNVATEPRVASVLAPFDGTANDLISDTLDELAAVVDVPHMVAAAIEYAQEIATLLRYQVLAAPNPWNPGLVVDQFFGPYANRVPPELVGAPAWDERYERQWRGRIALALNLILSLGKGTH